VNLYYTLALDFSQACVEYVGDFEVPALAGMESTVKYHFCFTGILTLLVESRRQCLVGSLTGAVASQSVTEVPKGWLNSVGMECRA